MLSKVSFDTVDLLSSEQKAADAVRYAHDQWKEYNYIGKVQRPLDLYNNRDPRWESNRNEWESATVFPVVKMLADKKSVTLASDYFSPKAFDTDPVPGKEPISRLATELLRKCIQQNSPADVFPLWIKYAILTGTSCMTATWDYEERQISDPNSEMVTKTISKKGGGSVKVRMPKLLTTRVREFTRLQVRAPGTWGIDHQAQNTSDALWFYHDDYMDPSQVKQFCKTRIFPFIDEDEVDGLGYLSHTDQRPYSIIGDVRNRQFWGQNPKDYGYRIKVRVFYTKEVRIIMLGNRVAQIIPNPYSMLLTGFPCSILNLNGTGGIMGTSDIDWLYPYIEEYNDFRNMRKAFAEITLRPPLMTTSMDENIINMMGSRIAGSVIPVNGFSEFQWMDPPQNSPVSEIEITDMRRDLESISGVNSATQGVNPSGVRGQGQLGMLLQQGQSTLGQPAGILHDRMIEVSRIIVRNGAQFQTVTINGNTGPIHYLVFNSVLDVKVLAGSADVAQKVQQFQNMRDILPLVLQIPGANVQKFIMSMLNLDDIPDPEQFFNPAMAGMPINPQQGPGIPNLSNAPAPAVPRVA